MNALADVAGMTETGPRKHHTKGLWSHGEGQQNCGKCCSLVACKMTAVSTWWVQKTLEVHSAWAHQLEKTGSTTSEGTRLVQCGGNWVHISRAAFAKDERVRSLGVGGSGREHGVRWVRTMCNARWKGRTSLEEF